MDLNKKPGIRFLGVDLLDVTFAVKGPPPAQGIKVDPSFKITRQISDNGRQLDLLMAVDLFGNVAQIERAPLVFTLTFHAQFQAMEGEHMPLEEFARWNAPAASCAIRP